MKKTKKISTISAMLLISALILCGCSPFNFGVASRSASETEIVGEDPGKPIDNDLPPDGAFSLNYDPNEPINPLNSTSETNLMFAPLIYESLFEVDESFNALPSRMVSDCESEDGIIWRITVDTSIPMHDGSTLTAEDVSYSIRRAMSSSVYKSRLTGVIGCGAYDGNHVMITLAAVNRIFPASLTIPIIKDGTIEEDAPAGTGPYAPNAAKTALLVFSEHADAKKLPIDKISLKRNIGAEATLIAFENSDIGLVVNDPNSASDLGYGNANVIRYVPTTNMHYIGYNCAKPFFATPATRHAITFAINREHIVTSIMGGTAVLATMPMSPVLALYNANYAAYFDYSLERCEEALKTAEVEDYDEDEFLEHMVTGIPMEVELDFIVNNDSPYKIAAARDIADNLNSMGIKVNVRELPWDSYLSDLVNGKFDMFYGEVKLGADFDLSSLLSASGSLNYGKLRDDTAIARISEYLAASDEDRLEKAELMCQYMVESAPITPICFEKKEVITHRGVVSGMSPTQYNIFNKFTDWKITVK